MGALTHLIRKGAIHAQRTGEERITETLLRGLKIDHLSETRFAEARQRKTAPLL